jgi:hypothetical protein
VQFDFCSRKNFLVNKFLRGLAIIILAYEEGPVLDSRAFM